MYPGQRGETLRAELEIEGRQEGTEPSFPPGGRGPVSQVGHGFGAPSTTTSGLPTQLRKDPKEEGDLTEGVLLRWQTRLEQS